MTMFGSTAIFSLFLIGLPFGEARLLSTARAAEGTVKDMLAAQVRSQGIACDKPQRAARDGKRSKPDHEVWVLKCENATYRVSRYPDLAAKVELIR